MSQFGGIHPGLHWHSPLWLQTCTTSQTSTSGQGSVEGVECDGAETHSVTSAPGCTLNVYFHQSKKVDACLLPAHLWITADSSLTHQTWKYTANTVVFYLSLPTFGPILHVSAVPGIVFIVRCLAALHGQRFTINWFLGAVLAVDFPTEYITASMQVLDCRYGLKTYMTCAPQRLLSPVKPEVYRGGMMNFGLLFVSCVCIIVLSV